MNSRNKGKVGERAWRDWLREQGYLKAYRGAQYCGLRGNPDVVCPETPLIHYEVKRGERLDVYGAVQQATRDCGSKYPVVAWRRNGHDWLAVMPAETFARLLRGSDLVQSRSFARWNQSLTRNPNSNRLC
jgi:hypothetical protein